MIKIQYRKGYKYQLAQTYRTVVNVFSDRLIDTEFIHLDHSGRLVIRFGYAWDGPSGPALDTPNFMRGSLIHDALYQLIRQGLLPGCYRVKADEELRKACLEDGMWKIRVWWVMTALKYFGGPAADPKNKKKIYLAPR